MAVTVVITVDCPACGDEAESRILMLDQPEEDGSIRIDAEMSVATSTFHCPDEDCNATVYSGGLDLMTDD